MRVQVGRGWGERRGEFPSRESPSPSRESSTISQIINQCAMSFKWHLLIGRYIFFLFLYRYLSKGLNYLPFATFFAHFPGKEFFAYLAQSNYLEFYGISTSTGTSTRTYEGRWFRTLKPRVVGHQNNPCLLPNISPGTCNPIKKLEYFLRARLDKFRRSWRPYKVTGVSSLGAQAAESMRIKVAESR